MVSLFLTTTKTFMASKKIVNIISLKDALEEPHVVLITFFLKNNLVESCGTYCKLFYGEKESCLRDDFYFTGRNL